jgi:GNAT superfamily N-acetyltransferase
LRVTGPALFAAGAFRAVELDEGDIPALQRFLDANPAYHVEVTGQGPRADEARREYLDGPPAGWPYRRRWLLGILDGAGAMAGVADVTADFLAAGVWHVGLFIVATARHGSGDAQALYAGLEAWMREGGARWLRLGVVEGNARAERFWEKAGYREVRRRHGVPYGGLARTVRVMAKPLDETGLPAYLELVPRDSPQAP